MAEEVTKTVEELQKEITQLKEELAALKQQGETAVPADAKTMEVVDAIDQSSEDADVKVETLCRWAAARAGAIVVAPLLGTVALMANEVYLVSRIARVYNVKLTERALIAFLGAVGSRMLGNILTTLIPFSVIQVPVAVGITYSLGKVTQRWMKDGMPSDMGPYVEMMSEWKDKAREQVDRLRESPLKNVPLGDETIDFMKKWGNTAKDKLQDVKEKGQELYYSVRHQNDMVEEIIEEKEAAQKAAAAESAAEETTAAAPEQPAEAETAEPEAAVSEPAGEEAKPADKADETVADQVKAAMEDAKKNPLEDK